MYEPCYLCALFQHLQTFSELRGILVFLVFECPVKVSLWFSAVLGRTLSKCVNVIQNKAEIHCMSTVMYLLFA